MSIVNWVKDPQVPPSEYVLDDRRVSGITTSLREGDESPSPEALPANAGRAFQGPIPVGEGFVLTPDEAREILADGRAPYERVIRPYLIGDDIANEPHQRPSRWIIDFASMPTTLRRWGSGRSRARVYLVRLSTKSLRSPARSITGSTVGPLLVGWSKLGTPLSRTNHPIRLSC